MDVNGIGKRANGVLKMPPLINILGRQLIPARNMPRFPDTKDRSHLKQLEVLAAGNIFFEKIVNTIDKWKNLAKIRISTRE